jgi:hypothetical protein
VLFRLIKLWFKLTVKLAGMLISALGGVAIGMILTRAGEITAQEDHGQLPATPKASQPAAKANASGPVRRRDHGRASAQA